MFILSLLFLITLSSEFDFYEAKFYGDRLTGTFTFTPFNGTIKMDVNLQSTIISFAHNYHIHEIAVKPGQSCYESGAHYDPLVAEVGDYNCDPNFLDTCYKGDLSGKLGPFNIQNENKFTRYDYQLVLDDFFNKSIVIHGANLNDTARPFCAELVGMKYPEQMNVEVHDQYYGQVVFRTRSDNTMGIITNINSHLNTFGHLWHVHETPVINDDCETGKGHYDPFGLETEAYDCTPDTNYEQCADGDLAGKYGTLSIPSENSYQDFQLTMEELMGKSVVIHEAQTGLNYMLCDNISDRRLLTAIAKFKGNLAGEILFQTHFDNSVQIKFKLSNVNRQSSSMHKIYIHLDKKLGDMCDSVGNVYDPTNITMGNLDNYHCNMNDIENTCFTGDLSGKYGKFDFPIGITIGDYELNVNDIVGRSIVIYQSHGSEMVYSCATILPTADLPELAIANFDEDRDQSIGGHILFRTRLDGTLSILTNLDQDLKTNSHKIHIHEDPIPFNSASCSDAGNHYDPTHVENAHYNCNPHDLHSCYYGDVSGKFGLFNIPSMKALSDSQLDVPSILQRSIVIHDENAQGVRKACQTISKELGFDYGVATFQSGSFMGTIGFRSIKTMEMKTKIEILINLYNNNNGMEYKDLKWMIYHDAIQDSAGCSVSHNEVYDPLFLETNNNYQCHMDDLATCKHGDLSGKFGGLNLPFKGTLIDEQFQQIQDLFGRSVVIMDNENIIGCANILPEKYEAQLALAEFDTGVILFRRRDDDRVSILTSFMDIKNPTEGHKWHIHDEKVDENGECKSSKGHYDPLTKEIGNYVCNSTDPINCYVGDLSGKFGTIDFPNRNSYVDDTFDLNDIIGRSVVIHGQNKTSPRIACATIREVSLEYLDNFSAKLEFQFGVEGEVQVMKNNSDLWFDYQNLKNMDNSISMRHNFHVHKQSIPMGGSCADAGAHYDPFGVEIADGSYSCDPTDLSTCYVGDLSGKYELKLALPMEFKINDPQFSITDIIGRSIVIHEKDSGSSRYACGTFFPKKNDVMTEEPTFVPTIMPSLVPTILPTSMPTLSPTSSPTEDDDALLTVATGGSSDNDSGKIVGIVFGVLFGLLICCLLIPITYYYYKFGTMDGVRDHYGAICHDTYEDLNCACCSGKKDDGGSKTFHLGRYNTPSPEKFKNSIVPPKREPSEERIGFLGISFQNKSKNTKNTEIPAVPNPPPAFLSHTDPIQKPRFSMSPVKFGNLENNRNNGSSENTLPPGSPPVVDREGSMSQPPKFVRPSMTSKFKQDHKIQHLQSPNFESGKGFSKAPSEYSTYSMTSEYSIPGVSNLAHSFSPDFKSSLAETSLVKKRDWSDVDSTFGEPVIPDTQPPPHPISADQNAFPKKNSPVQNINLENEQGIDSPSEAETVFTIPNNMVYDQPPNLPISPPTKNVFPAKNPSSPTYNLQNLDEGHFSDTETVFEVPTMQFNQPPKKSITTPKNKLPAKFSNNPQNPPPPVNINQPPFNLPPPAPSKNPLPKPPPGPKPPFLMKKKKNEEKPAVIRDLPSSYTEESLVPFEPPKNNQYASDGIE